jgi:hypothetical protein
VITRVPKACCTGSPSPDRSELIGRAADVDEGYKAGARKFKSTRFFFNDVSMSWIVMRRSR